MVRYCMIFVTSLAAWTFCTLAKSQRSDDEIRQIDIPRKVEFKAELDPFIEVHEPDGEVASNAKFIKSAYTERFSLDESLNTIPPGFGRASMPLYFADEGLIPRSFRSSDQFLAVWSHQGYCQLAIARLRAMPSIELLPWAKLEVTLKTKYGPDVDAPIVIESISTSDNQFRGMECTWNVVSDEEGIVSIPNFPPGDGYIRTHVRRQNRNGSSWEQHERRMPFHSIPGETVVLSLGGTGRSIQGKIAFPEGSEVLDFLSLSGVIESKATKEAISLLINADGTFESPLVPFGESSIEIESSPILRFGGQEPRFVGTIDFSCESTADMPQSVGEILLSQVPVTVQTHEESTSVSTDRDDFHSTQTIALVVGINEGKKMQYALISEEGQQLRPDLKLYGMTGWGTASQHVAFDVPRNRLYLTAFSKKDNDLSLFTLDLAGRILSTKVLPALGHFRIAVNKENGDLWQLYVRGVGTAGVEVFDLEGNSKFQFPTDAFTLCYSSVDQAMWMVGPTQVAKCDLHSGEVIASWRVPAKIWTFTSVIADPNGGVVCGESLVPDIPESANRLYRIDSNAELVACTDLGKGRIQSIASIANEIWVAGIVIDKISDAQNMKFTRASWCFDRELNFLADRKLDLSVVASSGDAVSVWTFQAGSLQKQSAENGTKRVNVSAPWQEANALWSSGN